MKVKLTTNIGSVDARRLGLSSPHQEGDVVDVSGTATLKAEQAIEEMIQRNWAVEHKGGGAKSEAKSEPEFTPPKQK